jgi:hypothetical protein
MANLILLILAAGLAVAAWLWQRRQSQPSRAVALLAAGLGCLTLLLALRFGGRTYPGIWHPESALLNSIFNGNWLFVEPGYDAALIAGAASVWLILRPPRGWMRTTLVWLKWTAVALAVAISLYGFYWAVLLERLP